MGKKHAQQIGMSIPSFLPSELCIQRTYECLHQLILLVFLAFPRGRVLLSSICAIILSATHPLSLRAGVAERNRRGWYLNPEASLPNFHARGWAIFLCSMILSATVKKRHTGC